MTDRGGCVKTWSLTRLTGFYLRSWQGDVLEGIRRYSIGNATERPERPPSIWYQLWASRRSPKEGGSTAAGPNMRRLDRYNGYLRNESRNAVGNYKEAQGT